MPLHLARFYKNAKSSIHVILFSIQIIRLEISWKIPFRQEQKNSTRLIIEERERTTTNTAIDTSLRLRWSATDQSATPASTASEASGRETTNSGLKAYLCGKINFQNNWVNGFEKFKRKIRLWENTYRSLESNFQKSFYIFFLFYIHLLKIFEKKTFFLLFCWEIFSN